ncbi:hypothetical protein VTN77DRAFT_7683 [Rasamsonia byssochlamydoides]|uniref:uncharacterized protein n=1 Tax=Rasamsonia byssochlamydoides TaxID=89139 RepID=UPI0037424DE3
MSCHDTQIKVGNGFEDNSSSDYGSDFTPDEEELLDELLARVATAQPTTTTTTSTTNPTTPAIPADDLTDVQPLVVADIEDYDIPQTARVPKVLGREAWSPSSPRRWQQAPPVLQNSGRQPPGSIAGHPGSTGVEHPSSTEGRLRDLERQQAREHVWTTQGDANQYESSEQVPSALNAQLSPLDRFRKPPNKALSVSDLIAPAWCELQYWYTLTKHGRKRRTAAMKQGSAVHKVLEEEVHTTVPVEITTKEDGWALRIWNVIQGLRTLREFGMTRELEIWGLVEDQIVTGIIDQLSYECPNRELEASAAAYYEDAQAAKAALPEYQMSITDYLLSPSQGGRRISDLGRTADAESAAGKEQQQEEESVDQEQPFLNIPRIYITDIKTRASRSIPSVSSSSFRPTQLQLQLYYHMLNRLVTSDDVTIEKIAQRYNLDSERTFTDAFIAEVGGLNDQFFDALSSPASDPDYVPPATPESGFGLPVSGSIPTASQDSTSILLAHNNLASLWALMKEQLRLTFLPSPNNAFISPSIPARTQPAFLEPYPTVLSPLLTAKYLSSADMDSGVPKVLGSRSFLFDPANLTSYVSDQMSWWRGQREPRGVEVMDAWKCRICEFREECSWRQGKELELATRRRRSRKVEAELVEAAAV